MKRYALLLTALVGFSAARADAQLNFNVAAGASMPMGAFADGAGTGWLGQVGVGVSSMMAPLSFRLDGAYHRWPGEGALPVQAARALTLNLKYGLPLVDSPFSPYLIAGGGAYRFGCVDEVSTCPETTTRAGWNAGLGARISSIGSGFFVEARYHYVDIGGGIVRFLPITAGLTFGY